MDTQTVQDTQTQETFSMDIQTVQPAERKGRHETFHEDGGLDSWALDFWPAAVVTVVSPQKKALLDSESFKGFARFKTRPQLNDILNEVIVHIS